MNSQSVKTKSKKKALIIVISTVAVFAVIAIAAAIYLCDFYRADEEAIEAFLPENAVWREKDGAVVFEPENPEAGLIFYPGGKVEYTSYIPLMYACYQRNILCVLVEMPFNLAVFDVNAADGIREKYPQIKSWYIGGHSLGGSMAAAHLESNHEYFDGLVLLGSYSASDLSNTHLKVLSVYGSEDKVMNKEKYSRSKSNLPVGFSELVIEGGCHAYFGMYGPQDGDGAPTISNSEQIYMTADAILSLISSD